MGSGHSHKHEARRGGGTQRLALTLGLVLVYMVAELIGGLWIDSLALLADAGHMFSDAGALALALFAVWFARRPATTKHTFGFHRTEILVALLNAATLMAISLLIFVEAVLRVGAPPPVAGAPMLAIAAGGLCVNLVSLWLLGGAEAGSINVRGAWLHVLSDTLGSAQAIVAAALIWAFDWRWADPVASMLIGLLVVRASWGLLREAVSVLMECAPGHIDVDRVRERILDTPGVVSVHDLHVWTITSGLESLSAHVVVADDHAPRTVLAAICGALHDHFGIDHVTVQLEDETCAASGSGI